MATAFKPHSGAAPQAVGPACSPQTRRAEGEGVTGDWRHDPEALSILASFARDFPANFPASHLEHRNYGQSIDSWRIYEGRQVDRLRIIRERVSDQCETAHRNGNNAPLDRFVRSASVDEALDAMWATLSIQHRTIGEALADAVLAPLAGLEADYDALCQRFGIVRSAQFREER